MYHSHTFPTIRGAWRRTRAAWHPSDKIIDGTGNRRNQQVGLMLSMWDTNRLVSQTRVPIAACREPAGKLWQLCMVLYVFEHKTRYILNPCSIYPHCGILTHRQIVRGALTRHRRFLVVAGQSGFTPTQSHDNAANRHWRQESRKNHNLSLHNLCHIQLIRS